VLVINPDTVKEEAVLVTVDQTGVTSPTLKITRAIETGATAQDHTTGHVVRHMIVGSDLQLAHDHIDNTSAHDATGGVVGLTKTQTLTNKTINLTSNTLTGTTAQFNAALSDADFATTALLEARVPVGAVNMWVTDTAPSGWLICDGSEKAIADYSALASVIGTNYGTQTNGSGGSGTTHFRLPDLRGRVPMGAGTGRNVAGDANLPTARTLGAKVSDAQTVTLTEAQMPIHTHIQNSHNHTQDPHDHSFTFSNTVGGTLNAVTLGNVLSAGGAVNANTATNQAQTATNQNAGSGQAHENTQPSTVINFIIKH
jgi:microcystin-dependent protein